MKYDLEKMKQQAANLQKKIHQAEARRDTILKQLEDDFNVTGEKAARKHLTRLRRQIEEKEQQFNEALRDFTEQYGQFIDSDD